MQSYQLAPNVYFCWVDDGGVFLDLGKNKYSGIALPEARVLSTWIPELSGGEFEIQSEQSDPQAISDDLAQAFIGAGFLTTSVVPRRSVAPPKLRCTESFSSAPYDVSNGPIRSAHIYHFAVAYLYVAVQLKLRRLRQIVHSFQNSKAVALPGQEPSASELLSLLTIYRQLRPWFFTAYEQCLLNSLVLAEFLHRFNVRPDFIIGVTTKPFFAHAWVQKGNVVLDDTVEMVSYFTPILTV